MSGSQGQLGTLARLPAAACLQRLLLAAPLLAALATPAARDAHRWYVASVTSIARTPLATSLPCPASTSTCRPLAEHFAGAKRLRARQAGLLPIREAALLAAAFAAC